MRRFPTHAYRSMFAILALLITKATLADPSCDLFAPRQYRAEDYSYNVISADFNLDGRPDLASSSPATDLVVIYLGGANGSFGSPHYAQGVYISFAIAAGDITDDGIPDIVVTSDGGPFAGLLRGLGDGAFAEITDLDVSINGTSVLIADFNSDGSNDIAVGNGSSTDILLNLGTGRFADPVNLSDDSFAYDGEAGDMDGDGDVDFVFPQNGDDSVKVLLNNGSGTGYQVFVYPSGDYAYGAGLGDIDGDGDLDVAVPGYDFGYLAILLNDGSGTLSSPLVSEGHEGDFDAVIRDFDQDGHMDVAVANLHRNDVSVYFGDGSGSVTYSTSIGVGAYPFDIITEDFDGDGNFDLCTADSWSFDLTVMFNDGNGNFHSPLLAEMDSHIHGYKVSDLDVDGDLDLIIRRDNPEPFESCIDELWRNDGHGAFTAETSPASLPVVVGDFNNDGADDTLYVGDGEFEVYLNDGYGDFGDPILAMEAQGGAVVCKDIDGDAILDLMVVTYDPAGYYFALGHGDGTFTPIEVHYPLDRSPYRQDLLDLTGDGLPEAVFGDIYESTITVVPNLGGGLFGEFVIHSTVDYPAAFAAGDLDQNGEIELIVADHYEGSVTFFRLSDDELIQDQSVFVSFAVFDVQIADIDYDDDLDLVMAGGDLLVLLNEGDGQFQPAREYTHGTSAAYNVEVADFTGDGRDDALLVDVSGESFAVFPAGAACECPADWSDDGVVDPLDLGAILSRFGCPVGAGDAECDAADANRDGIVDPLDAGYLLSRFGSCTS